MFIYLTYNIHYINAYLLNLEYPLKRLSKKTLSETDIINMLEFLIFVIFGGRVFQQTVGIHMGTNCALLFADLFHYS
jgi:hypothetical protein